MSQDDLIYKIGFSQVKNLTHDTALELLQRIGGPKNFFTMRREELVALSGIDALIFDDEYRKRLLSDSSIEQNFVEQNRIKTAFITDSNYPRRLVDCSDGPLMLYTYGSCEFDTKYSVGVVGTRHATPYGIDFTNRLVADLAKLVPGTMIVSGLAFGVDVAAHCKALSVGLPTIAVMAHGLSLVYPSEHRDAASRISKAAGSGLVTEYTSKTRPFQKNFLQRNRIVAGLCDALVVVESDMRGGSMSTARIASYYNRDVYAVPGRINDIYSRGTNSLISRNVASLITSAEDLVRSMGWESQPQVEEAPQLFHTLNKDEQCVLDYIDAHPTATVNDMCVGLARSYSSLSTILMSMELNDIIMRLPGGQYARTMKK